MENSIGPRLFSKDLCRISIDLSGLLRTATAWSIKQSFSDIFGSIWQKKIYDFSKTYVGFLETRSRSNPTPPRRRTYGSIDLLMLYQTRFFPKSRVLYLWSFWASNTRVLKRVSRGLWFWGGPKNFLKIVILIALMTRNPNIWSKFL